mmetsp:Transcript_64014/g.151442  ORF Transcript_64014/g.151442 Transcript_64014/m.151442 type:complete len:285 (-) Transcript_64014:43-897(-)
MHPVLLVLAHRVLLQHRLAPRHDHNPTHRVALDVVEAYRAVALGADTYPVPLAVDDVVVLYHWRTPGHDVQPDLTSAEIIVRHLAQPGFGHAQATRSRRDLVVIDDGVARLGDVDVLFEVVADVVHGDGSAPLGRHHDATHPIIKDVVGLHIGVGTGENSDTAKGILKQLVLPNRAAASVGDENAGVESVAYGVGVDEGVAPRRHHDARLGVRRNLVFFERAPPAVGDLDTTLLPVVNEVVLECRVPILLYRHVVPRVLKNLVPGQEPPAPVENIDSVLSRVPQ